MSEPTKQRTELEQFLIEVLENLRLNLKNLDANKGLHRSLL